MNEQEVKRIGQAEGWQLVSVIDNGRTKPYFEIFGTTLPDREARQLVYDRAKQNSALHIQVLRAVMHSRMTTPRKKR